MSVWNCVANDPTVEDCPKCGVSPEVLSHIIKDIHLVKCPECWKKSQTRRDRGRAVQNWNDKAKV